MTNRTITPRASLLAAIDNAAGPVALSNRVLIQIAFPLITGFLALNFDQFSEDPVTWLGISVAAYVATVLALLLARATVLPPENNRPMRLRMSIVLLLAGLVRGATVFVLGSQFGVIAQSELIFRLLNAPLFVYGAVATFAIFSASRLRHIDTLERLEIEKATLDELRGGIRERIKIQQAELLRRVQAVLTPAIAEVSKQIKKKSKNLTASTNLQNIVETVVRPLSHDVALNSNFDAEVQTAARRAVGAGLKQSWPQLISVGRMIVAPYITFATAAVALGFLTKVAPSNIGLAALIALTTGYVVFEALSRLLQPLWLPPILAFFAVTAAAILPPAASSYLLSISITAVSLDSFIQYVLFSFIVAWISFFLQFLRTQRAQAETEMSNAISELSILNAQLRQAAWMNRRRLAAILHGSVQSAIYAAAIKLAKAERPTKKDIRVIQEDISASLRKLEQLDGAETLPQVIEQIQQVWSGVVNITLTPIATELLVAFESNSVAASCVAEVVREAVSNAAKHGKAKNIQISITQATSGLVQVQISNDGKQLAADSKAGYGSSIFDEVSFAWSLQSQGQLTVLTASVTI